MWFLYTMVIVLAYVWIQVRFAHLMQDEEQHQDPPH